MNREQQDKIRLLLLQIIEKNGSIDDLYNLGYKYFQITQLLKNEIEQKNASFSDGLLRITEKGIKERELLLKKSGAKKINKIILPQLSGENKLEPIDVNEVFIPSRDELPF